MTEILEAAATDGVTTFLWVFSSSALGIAPSLIRLRYPAFLLDLVLGALLTSAFEVLISRLLRGSNYNPASSAAFHLAGLAPLDHPLSLAYRIPFQLVASVLALHTLLSLLPPTLRDLLYGPTSSVSTPAAAAAEGTLTFIMASALLWADKQWKRRILLRNLVLAAVNTVLCVSGARFTGPSMNPVIAFGWSCIERIKHPSWERFYSIYWLGSFVGAIAAGLLYRCVAPGGREGDRRRARRSRPLPMEVVAVVPLRKKGVPFVSAEFRAVLPRSLPLRALRDGL